MTAPDARLGVLGAHLPGPADLELLGAHLGPFLADPARPSPTEPV